MALKKNFQCLLKGHCHENVMEAAFDELLCFENVSSLSPSLNFLIFYHALFILPMEPGREVPSYHLLYIQSYNGAAQRTY